MASSLLQIGPGLFSANAVPPYRSWDEFSPVVRSGVEVLLRTRDEAERDAPFTSVSLRYIDAFRGDLLGGRSIPAFIREVLGFQIALPVALAQLQVADTEFKPHLLLNMPIANGMTMAVTVGEGLFNGEQAAMMHTHVVADEPVAADLERVMETLGRARQAIHSAFVNMTTAIHGHMRPQEV
jgi:uncharacterized protein (TIGR04255 family)